METKERISDILDSTLFKMVLALMVSTLLAFGAFQLIHVIGWPETVRWFFTSFVWIFVFLTGLFNTLNGRGPK